LHQEPFLTLLGESAYLPVTSPRGRVRREEGSSLKPNLERFGLVSEFGLGLGF